MKVRGEITLRCDEKDLPLKHCPVCGDSYEKYGKTLRPNDRKVIYGCRCGASVEVNLFHFGS